MIEEKQTPHSRTLSGDTQPIRHWDDLKLVEALISGHRPSWTELLHRHERTIYYAVLNTLRTYGNRASPDVVEDLQAEVLIELVKRDFRKLRRYAGRSKLDHWLKVVSSNYTIDYLRKSRPTLSLSSDTPSAKMLRGTLVSSEPAPDARLRKQQRNDILQTLFAALSEEDRRFVELFYGLELSFDEIAERMNTTVGAIYARKNRVRKKLTALAKRSGYID